MHLTVQALLVRRDRKGQEVVDRLRSKPDPKMDVVFIRRVPIEGSPLCRLVDSSGVGDGRNAVRFRLYGSLDCGVLLLYRHLIRLVGSL